MASDAGSRLTALPDQLMEEILLRLPAPEDLARATAACVAFSRYLTDGGFLARFRRRHGPPLLGFLDRGGSFNPALPPHPSQGAAGPSSQGVFYWHFFSVQIQRMVLIVLDTQSMHLSVRDILLEEGLAIDELQDLAIVEAGEGRLGLFGVRINYDRNVDEMSELCYFVRRRKNIDETRSGEWHLAKTIPLGFECHQSIKAVTERFLILERGLGWPNEVPADTGYFSVDVKTLKLERFCGLNRNNGGRALVYTNFPPTFLSPPAL